MNTPLTEFSVRFEWLEHSEKSFTSVSGSSTSSGIVYSTYLYLDVDILCRYKYIVL